MSSGERGRLPGDTRVTGDVLYLSRQDVVELLPDTGEQLVLAAQALDLSLDGAVQLPPKPAIHPREGAFIHAMPAYVGGVDIAALKWIGGSADNKARGLPYLSGLIILNDPETAVVTAIVDAADITAARTAAVSGLCVNRFAPPDWSTVAIVGYGVQGRAHARLLKSMNTDVSVVPIGADASPDIVRNAVAEADIVVTAIPFERPPVPLIEADWCKRTALILPIDFDAALSPAVARAADAFIVDHLETYAYYSSLGYFEGWPSPQISLADGLRSGGHPAPTVCCNLGMATLDAVFADAIVRRARERNVGHRLR